MSPAPRMEYTSAEPPMMMMPSLYPPYNHTVASQVGILLTLSAFLLTMCVHEYVCVELDLDSEFIF